MTKRNFLCIGAALIMILSYSIPVAGRGSGNKDTKKQAEVNQNQGLYIFIQARPVQEYEVLGTVEKKGIVWNGKPREMLNTIIKRAKRDYPECEGIIFDNIQMDHAICIKFK